MTLEGNIAFTVISDLRGDEKFLSTALAAIPASTREFCKREGVKRAKDWSGLDMLVLIGNTPGAQLSQGDLIKVLYGWEYLEKEFADYERKPQGLVTKDSKVRVPDGVKDTAMFASWLANVKDSRKPLDAESSNAFVTYVGRKSWGTGKWESEGVALKNYRKFWRNTAKIAGAAPFPVRIMPTDSVYYECVPEELDLPWEEFKKGGLKFKSIPISRIQNKHFIPPFAIKPRRRDGKEYNPELYNPEAANICFGYLFPTPFAKILKDDARERLLILSYDVHLQAEDRQNRLTSYPGTNIAEEVLNVASTYVFDGKRAWRIRDIWSPKEGKLVEQRVEPLDFTKPITVITETPETEEDVALRFLSSPQENWEIFLREVAELSPAAAEDLREQGIQGFKPFAQLHSSLFDKVKGLEAVLLGVHGKNETFFYKLLEVLGATDSYNSIKDEARRKFRKENDTRATEEEDAWAWTEATNEILRRYTAVMQTIDHNTASIDALSAPLLRLYQPRLTATDKNTQVAECLNLMMEDVKTLASVKQDGATKATRIIELEKMLQEADQRPAQYEVELAAKAREIAELQETLGKTQLEFEGFQKLLGEAQDDVVRQRASGLKLVYDCYRALKDEDMQAAFEQRVEPLIGKEMVDLLKNSQPKEAFEIGDSKVAERLYENRIQLYLLERATLTQLLDEHPKIVGALAQEQTAHTMTRLERNNARRDANALEAQKSVAYGARDTIKREFSGEVEKRAAAIAQQRIDDANKRASDAEGHAHMVDEEREHEQAQYTKTLAEKDVELDHARLGYNSEVASYKGQIAEKDKQLGELKTGYERELTENGTEIEGLRAEVFGLNDEKRKLEDALEKEIAKPAASTAAPTNGVELSPERVWETAQEAYGLVQKGNYAEGITKYTTVLENISKDDTSRVARLYTNRGVAYLKSKDYEKARADFTEACKLDPAEKKIEGLLEEATRLKIITTKK